MHSSFGSVTFKCKNAFFLNSNHISLDFCYGCCCYCCWCCVWNLAKTVASIASCLSVLKTDLASSDNNIGMWTFCPTIIAILSNVLQYNSSFYHSSLDRLINFVRMHLDLGTTEIKWTVKILDVSFFQIRHGWTQHVFVALSAGKYM